MCGWVVQWDGMCVQTKRVDVLCVYADAGCGHVDAQVDVLHVNADANGGRGRVDAWTQMTVKKERKATERKKRKTYPVDADDEHWHWHVDVFRADVLACGRG